MKRALARRPDLVLAPGLAAMSPLLRLAEEWPPVFFDLNDIAHRWFARKLLLAPEWRSERLRLAQATNLPVT